MKKDSFQENIVHGENGVKTVVILETSFSKEIRIVFKKGQVMKEHKAGFPIIVHILKGSIEFGVEGVKNQMDEGAIITLDSNVPHDLFAQEDSIVRLTLSKQDNVDRVQKVVEDSKQ